LFGLSKKAFKRAAGRLLKQRLVVIDEHGCLVQVAGGAASNAGPSGTVGARR
jgi:hypothetical protein